MLSVIIRWKREKLRMKLPALYLATNLFYMIRYRSAMVIMVSVQIKNNEQSELTRFADGEGSAEMKDRALTAFGSNYPRLQSRE